MRSIQTKIIIIMVGILVIFGTFAFAIAYNNTKIVLDKNMRTVLNLTGDNEKKKLDEALRSMEQSVNTIYNYAYQKLENDPTILENEKKGAAFLEDFGNLALNIAENTMGSISAYFRFNPALYGGRSGFWYLYDQESGEWVDNPTTDIDKYDREDVGRVGWYYVPIKHKKPIWMEIYYNQNVDIEMFTYGIPFFFRGFEVGVVAMDIDVKVIRESVSKISLYETGKALLLQENGDVVYHENYPEGCGFLNLTDYEQELVKSLLESEYDKVLPFTRDDGIERRLVLKKLRNGMILGIYVPLGEVNAPQNTLFHRYLGFMCIMLLIAISICILWIRSVTQPLKELTRVVKEYEAGRLETEISVSCKDEVGVLADSFRQMARSLKDYIEVINEQARTDALTGLKNSSAYNQVEESIDSRITKEALSFCVVVMDVNNLKRVNDTYGHRDGDELIQLVAGIIEKVFGRDYVFRIGGDEFVAILPDTRQEDVRECMDKADALLKAYSDSHAGDKWRGSLSIAMGMAGYRAGVDRSYRDVFNVADGKMYEDKQRKKAKSKQRKKAESVCEGGGA